MFVFTRVHPLQGSFGFGAGSAIEQNQTPDATTAPVATGYFMSMPVATTTPGVPPQRTLTPTTSCPTCPPQVTCETCPPQRECQDCPTCAPQKPCAPCEEGFQRQCYSPARWPWVLGTVAGGIATLGFVVAALKSRKK